MRRLNNYERGFIEGFLDADGCIMLGSYGNKRRTPRLTVSFSNNSSEVLNKIQKILGVNKKLVEKRYKSNINYQFALSPKESYELLKQITLVVKEYKRNVGIECYEYIQSCKSSAMNNYTKPENFNNKIEYYIKKFKMPE